jgi:uncharacterized protein
MARPLFVVSVKDLEKGERTISWEIPVGWLEAALRETEAVPRGAPGQLEVTLGLSGRQVIVRGSARAAVAMPCARTLEPVDIDIDAEVVLLLVPESHANAGSLGSARSGRRGRSGAAPGPTTSAAPRRRRKTEPRARGGKSGWDDAPLLTGAEAAEDTYDGERVILDPFVREFILLELPLVPLRSDLRDESTLAIDAQAESAASSPPADPRMAPLVALAERMRNKE